MNRDPYIIFLNAQGNAVFVIAAWAGAVLGPMFIMATFGDFSDSGFCLGIGLSTFPLLAICYGAKALSRGNSLDFVVYALITALVLLASVAHMLLYPVFWFGST
tara:strand:+ start:6304 stop:6615 length:312 start_codon:yes stop_codon:yes gene_type:complete